MPIVLIATRYALWVGVGLAASAVALAAVWRQVIARSASDRPLSLIVAADTAGWIVPCGCASNQSGGLARRGTYVARASRAAHVLVADAGGAPGGTSEYQRVKFASILRGEMAMGLVAHNLGGPELALGADYLRELATEFGAPFVSANVYTADGKRPVDPLVIVEAAGQRVALVGVVSPEYATKDLQVRDPKTEILNALAEDGRPYDWLIVLAYLPEHELAELAAQLPEAHAVVGGPTGQSIAPHLVGPTLVAAATNKGKFLVHLDAPRRPGAGPWSGRVVEMGPDLADDATQNANLDRYLAELAERDFAADQTGLAPALAALAMPESYQVAGNDACLDCHTADCSLWAESKHAHAWHTLAAKGFHVDSYCQQCHTTGFGLPGGFTSARTSPDRAAVGCESCHGPSLAHVRQPLVRTPFAARDQCTTCHDLENSPRFQYDPYWDKIRHGEVAALPRKGPASTLSESAPDR